MPRRSAHIYSVGGEATRKQRFAPSGAETPTSDRQKRGERAVPAEGTVGIPQKLLPKVVTKMELSPMLWGNVAHLIADAPVFAGDTQFSRILSRNGAREE